jgi:hypothetical protein
LTLNYINGQDFGTKAYSYSNSSSWLSKYLAQANWVYGHLRVSWNQRICKGLRRIGIKTRIQCWTAYFRLRLSGGHLEWSTYPNNSARITKSRTPRIVRKYSHNRSSWLRWSNWMPNKSTWRRKHRIHMFPRGIPSRDREIERQKTQWNRNFNQSIPTQNPQPTLKLGKWIAST